MPLTRDNGEERRAGLEEIMERLQGTADSRRARKQAGQQPERGKDHADDGHSALPSRHP